MKKQLIYVLLITVPFFLTQCDRKRVFEKNYRIKNNEWSINDTLKFNISIADSSNYYDILLNVRTGGLYEYSNLFLFVSIEAPSGKTIEDKFEITLADKNGKWFGSGLGDIKSLTVPFRSNVRFGLPGIYKFKIVQGMRKDVLPYVFDAGIRIQHTRK